MVGYEDEKKKLIEYLLEESEELDVISIAGIPGVGKTTFAGEIFRDPEIKYEFPTRIWLTVSQEFSEKSIFLYMLKEFTALSDDIYHKTNRELAHLVAEFLRFSKFLLVVDDLWEVNDWFCLRSALPMTGKVLITTRHLSVCHSVNPRREPYMMRLLSPEESWLLLCYEVFGKPEFPSNLEAQGKLVAEKCEGLLFAVVLVGGILAKKLEESTNAEDALEKALTEISGSFLGADSGFKLAEQLIILSYEKLPHHLRKCFLYVGMFPEDYEIPAWKLICEKYLDDLISSNLLRVDELNASGKVKTIVIHGMLRCICSGKVKDEGGNFFKEINASYDEVSKEHEYQRLCIHHDGINFLSRQPNLPSVRSFLCFSRQPNSGLNYARAIAAGFKELRVLDIMPLRIRPLSLDMYELLHLRYLALCLDSPFLPADFSKFRNIQTLIIQTTSPTLDVGADILNMIELRHFKTNASATLPNPTASSEGGDNIQTLGMISPETCTEQFFNRARNLKKLGIRGLLALLQKDENRSFHSLAKLEDLEKLKLINDDDVYPL